MKKLFLASFVAYSIDKLIAAFKLVPQNLTVAFVPTAGGTYPEEKRGFVAEDRGKLVEKGFKVKDVDLKGKTKDELMEESKGVDIIFVAGGNTFYLLEKAKESGFDELAKCLVGKGVIYVGSSAGAALAGPDIEPVGPLDDPSKAPNLKSTKGLGLVNFVILPHWGKEKFKERYEKVMKRYGKSGYKLIKITDEQAVVVEGNKYNIV
ncbi:MAG TPA: Type 1 glutamine amidotransferase-like domain-containing protein [Candidatus Nanoarchaeia archaeon]